MYEIQADLLQTSSSATLYLSTPPSQTAKAALINFLQEIITSKKFTLVI